MIETEEIKKQVKNALYEILREDNSFIRDILEDMIEEIVLTKAIQEGEKSEFVKESKIMDLLPED